MERNAGSVGCDLGKIRIGAGADVLRGAGNAGRAVVAQLDSRLRRESRGDPGAPGHAPAQRQAVALHRADLRSALRPAEGLRPALEAFEQVAGREWQLE